MKLFHGTTWNRFRKIKECGYLGNGSSIWNVSEPDTTYFWTEKFLRDEGYEEDYIYDGGVRYALESADIALSQEREDLRRVVLIFDSEDLEKIGELETDYSSENMDHCLQFTGKIPINLIKEAWIDRCKLDLLGLYFVGLANSLSDMGPTVNNYWRDLDTELVEASVKVYENLCNWYLEEYETIEKLEVLDVSELDPKGED